MKCSLKSSYKTVLPAIVGGVIGGMIATSFPREDRVQIDDYVVGSKFKILEVNDKPVDRVEHGWVITRVPKALVPEGSNKLKVEEINTGIVYELDANILKGLRYRIESNEDGSPIVIARMN